MTDTPHRRPVVYRAAVVRREAPLPDPTVPPPVQKPWCWDTLFPDIRAAWEAHDKTCESLPFLWLGRSGGVSCPSDMTDCATCGVTFYNEGVTNVTWDDPEADDRYLCGCCARSEGWTVTYHRSFGISHQRP